MTLVEMEKQLAELQRAMTGSDARLIGRFLQVSAEWRNNSEPPASLVSSLTKLHGNIWFSTDEESNTVYDLLRRFRETMESLRGAPFSEILATFDLSSHWTVASHDERAILRKKLLTSESTWDH